MTYSVLVQSTKKQDYNAIVLGLPFLRAEGATKKEAIDKVRRMLARLMASGEIVQIEVDEMTITSLDEPLPEVGSPQICSLRSPTTSSYGQELETLSAILRAEALSDGQTVADVLQKLPYIRREICEELYGKKQIEMWEKERRDGE
jgi:hypothetical protein